MNILQRKKIIAELARVQAARLEMEVKVQELNEALIRINEQITIQENREKELAKELEGE
jgi:hypothetical protein